MSEYTTEQAAEQRARWLEIWLRVNNECASGIHGTEDVHLVYANRVTKEAMAAERERLGLDAIVKLHNGVYHEETEAEVGHLTFELGDFYALCAVIAHNAVEAERQRLRASPNLKE